MWRHIASNALTFLGIGLFLLGGIVLWGRAQYDVEGPLTQTICVRVEGGASMRTVSADLEAQGAVSSSALLRIGANYEDKARLLKAGSFLVEPGASMREIVDAVTRGGASTCGTEVVYRVGVTRITAVLRELDPATNKYVELEKFTLADEEAPARLSAALEKQDTRIKVTMAEGVTSWQVVEALKSLTLLKGAIEEIPPEGSLAPDSYEFKRGDDRAVIIEKMLEAQVKRVSEAWAKRDPDLPVNSPEELVVLASIIEKETGVAEERGQVASVFVNRLNEGIKLQTDPTVIYGITKGQGVLGRGLRRSELRRETPYNTYVIEGLPPTPIANPGMASLMAAAQPLETEFIFFVADGTGGHAFAKSLEEHNENVARWRQIEAERQNDGN